MLGEMVVCATISPHLYVLCSSRVLPVCLVAFHIKYPEVHPVLGEKVACATIFLHLYTYCRAARPHPASCTSVFWDFNTGVCYVMKLTVGKRNSDRTLNLSLIHI